MKKFEMFNAKVAKHGFVTHCQCTNFVLGISTI